MRVPGLVAATFTPFASNGQLALHGVSAIVDRLVAEGVGGIFVAGSTGEGASLTDGERRTTLEAYVSAAAGRLPVIAHVGHNSLAAAAALAEHAAACGADAIACAPPSYFKPSSVEALAACMAEAAAGAPELPFYYYHIPPITGVDLPMVDLLRILDGRVPRLAGLKFSSPHIAELQRCIELDGGRFDVLFGCDEMLLSAWAAGARGAVGSTYNFAAPLYHRVIDAFESGDLAAARRCQSLAVAMVAVQLRYGGLSGLKATMALVGDDCGPPRLPLDALDRDEVDRLRRDLAGIGFFDWARP